MSLLPYSGITGFTNAREVERVLEQVPPSLLVDRKIMVGALASSKTLSGKTNRWPKRFPPVEQIGSIFGPQPDAINLIHYSTDEPLGIYEQLVGITEISGPNVDGAQLNVPWPDVKAVRRYRCFLEGTAGRCREQPARVVLQIGRKAMEKADHDPSKVADLLTEYTQAGAITDVLVDTSGGLGKPFSPVFVRELLLRVRQGSASLGLGVAGGLWEHSLCLLEPLLMDFPLLSFDAESKLRHPDTDALDCAKATRYLVSFLKRSDEIVRNGSV